MASLPSANSNSGGSEASPEPGPNFRPWNGPPEEHTVLVQSNEVHLIPLGDEKRHHKLEVTAQDTLDDFSTAGKRLTDDLIIFSSRSGVIFGRIPNSLSDDAVVQWLECFLKYIRTSDQAAWWRTGRCDPCACHVFVPMHAKRTKWIYSNTRNDKERPERILGILDTYVQKKPSLLQLLDWEDVESCAGEIFGKCYFPRQHQRRRNIQRREEERSKDPKSTRISFIWDPVEQSQEVRLRDEKWKDELLGYRSKIARPGSKFANKS